MSYLKESYPNISNNVSIPLFEPKETIEKLLLSNIDILCDLKFLEAKQMAPYDGLINGKSFWDKKYWKYNGLNSKYISIRLKQKKQKKPSKAILEIFNRKDKWMLDCALWIQVVLIKTYLDKDGEELFNNKYKNKKFTINQHESSPIVYTHSLKLEDGSYSEKDNTTNQTLPKTYSNESLLVNSLKPGDIVTIKNLWHIMEKISTSFTNENIIYLGSNKFAAFGLNSNTKSCVYENLISIKEDFATIGLKYSSRKMEMLEYLQGIKISSAHRINV
ncbi:hypothetical protein [Lacinutrix cladophorae]